MTEKLLLIRSAATPRYFILGTDFPCARIFDSSTSSLIGVIKPEKLGVGLLSTETLTSVTVGQNEGDEQGVKEINFSPQEGSGGGEKGGVALPNHYAAGGFSNGTIIVHHVEHNATVAEILVSPTQQAVQSMAICGEFLWCLTADHKVSVVYLHPPHGKSGHYGGAVEEGVQFQFSCHPETSSLTVVRRGRGRGEEEDASSFSPSSNNHNEVEEFDVLVAGTSTSVYAVTVHRSASTKALSSAASRHFLASLGGGFLFHMEEKVSFASQGSTVSFAWLSRCSGRLQANTSSNHHHSSPNSSSTSTVGRAAITASPQDTTIRIWDVQSVEEQRREGLRTAENAAALQARCRRTLVCGQRIAHVSVLEGTPYCFIAATTFTGAVLVWAFRGGFLSRSPEPLPISPDMILFSPVSVGKLLLCQLLPTLAASDLIPDSHADMAKVDDKTRALESLSALLLRGSFALPHFERIRVSQLPSPSSRTGWSAGTAERAHLSILASLAIAPSSSSSNPSSGECRLREVPLSDSFRQALELHDAVLRSGGVGGGRLGGEAAAFEVIDRLWSRQQIVSVVATKASMTGTEAFPVAKPYRAASMADLPVKKMTLEQRLREVAKLYEDSSHSSTAGQGLIEEALLASTSSSIGGGIGETSSFPVGGSLGVASVPLYQALHANDVSAVMELLSIASRSPEGVRATVMSLQLPYCLQLLTIISERLGISSRSTSKGGDAQGQATSAVTVGGGLSAISSRTPLLQWIDAIIQHRGMEIYKAQIAYDAIQKRKKQKQGGDADEEHDYDMKRTEKSDEFREAGTQTRREDSSDTIQRNMTLMAASPPKDFIAPILHEYRRMTRMYDTLATLHGRMGVFLGVRPSEKNHFYNRSRKMLSSNLDSGREEDTLLQKSLLSQDIIFPSTFAEVASRRRGGNYVVKVKSKAAARQAQYQKRTTDTALLREAEKRAAKALRDAKKQGKSLLDDDEDNTNLMDSIIQDRMGGNGGELDLEELEAMNLDDDENEDECEGEGEEEEDNEEEEEEGMGRGGHSRKRSRKEHPVAHAEDQMLADQPSEEEDDAGAHSDSSSAVEEFSEGSDEEDPSTASSSSDEEDDEEDEEDEEEESLSSLYPGTGNSSDDEEDDGMGEDMAELLTQSGSSSFNQKEKRIRVD